MNLATLPSATIIAGARAHPDRAALVINDVPVSYRELAETANATSRRLSLAGAKPGTRVGICSESKRDFITGLLAAAATGATAMPLPENDDAQTRELIEAAAPVAIAGPVAGLGKLDLGSARIETVRTDEDGGVTEPEPAPPIGPEDAALLLYSSGTTSSRRKLIEIPHRALDNTIRELGQLVAIPGAAVEYLISPPSHAFGLGRFCAVMAKGGTLVLNDGIFNPFSALVALRKYGCVSLAGVSSAISLLVEKFPEQLRDYGAALRWMEISSVAMPTARKHQLRELLPEAQPIMSYGLTEAMRSTFLNYRASPEKLDSVGLPRPDVQVAILDAEGRPLTAGAEGEIALRGGNLAKGYWKRPDLWQAHFAGGWFRTGDRGRMDGDGFVFFLGRNDDVINSGGNKISPDEVEGMIADVLGNRAFCVVGRGDDTLLGEVAVLCIEGTGERDGDAEILG